MVKVGIVGASGYTGEELVWILSGHSGVSIASLTAIVDAEGPISGIVPRLAGRCDVVCKKPDTTGASIDCVDIVFLALPHKVSMAVAPKYLARGKRVIDLSADYRLSADLYAKWYGSEHTDAGNLAKAVYGLSEVFTAEIKKAKLIANPGCYPTSILLPLIPLLAGGLIDPDGLIADSKSGVTGAGRKPDIQLSFGEVNESVRAYKMNEHQHKPEIVRILSETSKKPIDIVFTPHLVPLNRGILSTIYARPKKEVTEKSILSALEDFYKGKPFVGIREAGSVPQIKNVAMSNRCEIGAVLRGGTVIIVSCIDNLLKGAAGQAVQNMNIMCGFKETEGLAL
ncbi:MAG: N-acetyl-gamma-glutamyl-phosphate reductase [Candidatus Omnitrophota bacterium]